LRLGCWPQSHSPISGEPQSRCLIPRRRDTFQIIDLCEPTLEVARRLRPLWAGLPAVALLAGLLRGLLLLLTGVLSAALLLAGGLLLAGLLVTLILLGIIHVNTSFVEFNVGPNYGFLNYKYGKNIFTSQSSKKGHHHCQQRTRGADRLLHRICYDSAAVPLIEVAPLSWTPDLLNFESPQ
jgi:hypothetical protein